MKTDPLVRPLHPFTKSGMGYAPFTFCGVATIPSPSLAEANPTAYMNALAMLPRDLANGCGSCAHCGTAIMNIFIVRNADGKKWGVGCDCIAKTEDKPLVRASVMAKRQASRKAKHAAWLAEIVNPETGETREQAMQREQEEKRAASRAAELAATARMNAVADLVRPLGEQLMDGRHGFADNVGFGMKMGILPTGRGLDITIEILAKREGRTGSKKFLARVAELEAIFAQAAALS